MYIIYIIIYIYIYILYIGIAAECSGRIRPVLFGGPNKGPNLPLGAVPPKPHPLGLTTTGALSRKYSL